MIFIHKAENNDFEYVSNMTILWYKKHTLEYFSDDSDDENLDDIDVNDFNDYDSCDNNSNSKNTHNVKIQKQIIDSFSDYSDSGDSDSDKPASGNKKIIYTSSRYNDNEKSDERITTTFEIHEMSDDEKYNGEEINADDADNEDSDVDDNLLE